MTIMAKYGAPGFDGGQRPASPVLSLDLRQDFGFQGDDETAWITDGSVPVVLFRSDEGYDVGEVRLLLRGVEVRLVSQLTGRGVNEVTPQHLSGSVGDLAYRRALADGLGLAEI